MSRTAWLILAIAAGLSAAAPESGVAQNWPARPITLVVASAAGSSIDVAGRIVAARLSERLGQSVVVENIAGAGGMTGAARVAKAMPDGYQVLFGGSATHTYSQTLYKNPLYNAATDFAPVALIAETPSVVIVRNDLPAQTLQEFVAYAKQNQAKMQYGSAGSGSAAHLACALLNAAIGVTVTHIPYRGGGPAMQDLIAGRIDYQCLLAALAIPQIEGKTVKAIAILAPDRSPLLPALASAHEQGLANFDASSWYGIFLPERTPAAIVQKLHDATAAMMQTPSVQIELKAIGADLVTSERRSPEYLAQFVRSEIEKWGSAIRAAGVPMQ